MIVEAEVPTSYSSDVLIVGAGPAGLTTALELARLGVRSTVLTKYPYTAHTPRAHVVNQRTMEILRGLGIEQRVLDRAAPQEYMEHNSWYISLAGHEVARISAWGAGPADRTRYAEASPCHMCNLPQHLLEPILLDAVRETGLVDVRFGHEFLALTQDDDGVTVQVQVRESGRRYSLRSHYLVGADGANSQVMRQIGLEVEGPPPLGDVLFVWFKADLTKYVEHRPGILYHTLVPDGRAGLIMVEPWDQWIAGVAGPDVHDLDAEAVRERICAGIGDSSIDIEIKTMSRWTINHQYAPQYSRSRVFCMGDAVHRHSPWNGLGLNTGIGDAHNLAWKLGMVLSGLADPALLETYSTERAPVGKQVVERALATNLAAFGVFEVVGVHPGMAPEAMWKQLNLLEEDSEAGEELRGRLDAHVRAISGPGFNALGAELGYRYRTGAVVPDGTPEPMPEGDPDENYLATTWPGARLPHVWLELARTRLSSLDLVRSGRFTLFVGIAGGDWDRAAEDAAHKTRCPVDVIHVGGVHGVRDFADRWADVRGVNADGAVLVRPDGHVAWRAADGDGAKQLTSVLLTVLGRQE